MCPSGMNRPECQSGRDLNDPKTRRKMTIPLMMGYFKMNIAKWTYPELVEG